jgi:hypothetical protein
MQIAKTVPTTTLTRLRVLLFAIAALVAVLPPSAPAVAATFSGELQVGYSDSFFQIGQGTSSMVININAIGARDPTMCAFCNSAYTDNYTVNFLGQSGTMLASANEINYLYYNVFSSSHGIGAAPVWIAVPAGTTTIELVSRLSIAGLLGADGHPLSFGNLSLLTDGSIAAATPIPPAISLFATAFAVFALLGWRARKSPVLRLV